MSNASRYRPRLEAVEDRVLLTLFAVTAVLDVSAEQEAVASVTYSPGVNDFAQVSMAGDAFPAGQGDHHGAFHLGALSNVVQIDTLPAAGQNFGDPITVAFAYSYTGLLQDFYDHTPVNPAYVQWSGLLDAANAGQWLFDGSFMTDGTAGDQAHEDVLIELPLNVGDSLFVHVSSDGEAFAAEPHFKDRVAFNADFLVQDSPDKGSVPANVRAALFSLVAQDRLLEQPRNGPSDSAVRRGTLGPGSLEVGLPHHEWVPDGGSQHGLRHSASQKPTADNSPAVLLSVFPQPAVDHTRYLLDI